MTGTTMQTAPLPQMIDPLPQPARTRIEGQKFARRFALGILLALMCYQLFLIYLNTHGHAVSNGLVAACEAVILGVAAIRILPQRPIADFAAPALVAAYLAILSIMREQVDVFAPRDLAIIVLSYWMGQTVPSVRDVSRIVTVIFGVVFVFACAEYFFTDVYLQQFDILGYATARGVVPQQLASYSHTKLFFSGTRFTGRNLLPFLGNQRVSSIFYEPVSMGNFGAILAMWGLSFDRQDWRRMLGFLAMAVFVIVACDSRFASLIVLGLVVVRLTPPLQSRTILLLAPAVLLAGLVSFTYAHIANGGSDDLPGRIMRTGEALVAMDMGNIFGGAMPEYLGDSGIPYSIEVFGALLCAALWAGFSSLKMNSAQGKRLHAMAAMYCLGLLLISGTSFYSSKTGALLWFLLGAVSARAVAFSQRPAQPARETA